MRLLGALLLAGVLAGGCGSGSPRPTGPTATTSGETAHASLGVSVDLRNSFLFQHNAAAFGRRTYRWVPPIPLHVLTGDPEVDGFVVGQFNSWDGVLRGAGGRPLFAPSPIETPSPERGIHLFLDDLDGDTLGVASPFAEFVRQALRGRRSGSRTLHEVRRHVVLPEILSTGEIRRCIIVLDDPGAFASDFVFQAVLRHETGHCLGFQGHVATGLMAPRCCSLTVTPAVRNMMQLLYRLPPGTPVTP